MFGRSKTGKFGSLDDMASQPPSKKPAPAPLTQMARRPPLLHEFKILEALEENETPLAAAVRGRALPPQSAATLSRMHRSFLAGATAQVAPLWDGERFILLLETSGPPETMGCWAVSESGVVSRVIATELLLGFAIKSGGFASLFEVTFVWNPKTQDYALIVIDCLVCAGQPVFGSRSVTERMVVVDEFAAYCTEGRVPFVVIANVVRPLAEMSSLLKEIRWRPEDESRVFVRGELHLAVLGIRIAPLDMLYTPGTVNDRILDWFYPRQAPLWLATRLVPTEEGTKLAFFLRDAPLLTSAVQINPAHAPEIVEDCILKLILDPAHGYYNVRGIFPLDAHALTSAATLMALSVQAQQQINKDEIVAWLSQTPLLPKN